MPQGFQIGPITIRYYALIILAGAMVAGWIASKEADRHGRDKEMIWDMLPWLLIGGILGARLWHVLTPSASNAAMGLTTKYYFAHPLEILKIWKGGLGIPGGVIGGCLALWIYTKGKKESFLEWTDIISPGLLVGQAIGRWGNFVNQELYGGPSNLPWAITIDPIYRLPGFEAVEKYHPLFLYESLLNLLAAGLLLLIARKNEKKLYKGDIFLFYLVFYPAIRFGLEFLRLDPSSVNGFNINQSVMAVVAVLSASVLIYRHFIHPRKEVKIVETEGIDVSDMALVEPAGAEVQEGGEGTAEEIPESLIGNVLEAENGIIKEVSGVEPEAPAVGHLTPEELDQEKYKTTFENPDQPDQG